MTCVQRIWVLLQNDTTSTHKASYNLVLMKQAARPKSLCGWFFSECQVRFPRLTELLRSGKAAGERVAVHTQCVATPG